jgi:hypothetical protein
MGLSVSLYYYQTSAILSAATKEPPTSTHQCRDLHFPLNIKHQPTHCTIAYHHVFLHLLDICLAREQLDSTSAASVGRLNPCTSRPQQVSQTHSLISPRAASAVIFIPSWIAILASPHPSPIPIPYTCDSPKNQVPGWPFSKSEGSRLYRILGLSHHTLGLSLRRRANPESFLSRHTKFRVDNSHI